MFMNQLANLNLLARFDWTCRGLKCTGLYMLNRCHTELISQKFIIFMVDLFVGGICLQFYFPFSSLLLFQINSYFNQHSVLIIRVVESSCSQHTIDLFLSGRYSTFSLNNPLFKLVVTLSFCGCS